MGVEKIEVVAETGVIAGLGTMIDTVTEIVDMTVSEIEIQIVLAVMIPGADEGHDLVRGIVEEIMIGTGTSKIFKWLTFFFSFLFALG